jgi:hypothetical protein
LSWKLGLALMRDGEKLPFAKGIFQARPKAFIGISSPAHPRRAKIGAPS